VNQQVKAGLSAIRDFLAGRSGETEVAAPEDKATREVFAAELLATMSGHETSEAARVEGESASGSDTQELPPVEPQASPELANEPKPADEPKPAENSTEQAEERERARQLFLDHGYFDEAVLNLRAANSATERAAAARVLGLVGSQRGTPHLIAAMFDDDLEVRRAAEEALSRIGDASVSQAAVAGPLNVGPLENEGETDAHEATASVMDQQEVHDRSGRAEEVMTESDQAGGSDAAPEMTEAGGRDARGPSKEVDADAPGPSEGVDAESEGIALPSPTRETISDTPIASEVVLASELTTPADVVRASELTVRTSELPTARNVVDAPGLTVDPDEIASDLTAVDSAATADEQQLLLEEGSIREELAQLELQLLETVSLREQSEQEIAQSNEREARLRAEAAARRSEEEEIQKRADEKAERRRAQEREALIEEQAARAQTEADAQRLADAEASLRLKAAELKRTAEKRARQREDSERARLEAAEAARLTEATRTRDEAKLQHDAELIRLHNEDEWLRAKTEETRRLHAEVAAAREKADAEAERLVEAQARMHAAEQARNKAEVERAQLEAEIKQKVEKALQLLEDTRRRGQEEQERLEEEARRRGEAEQRRRTELEAMKARAEADSRELAEFEQQTLAQVNSLRIADNETRKRIADAEVRRRGAEDAYNLVAAKVQRLEAEAHARVKEEEQMRARLEAERRTVAVEAQSRADQEKRVREEIEMFRRLEEQERPRIEEAILQRAEAEARLRHLRQRLKSEDEARLFAEDELRLSGSPEDFSSERPGETAQRARDIFTAKTGRLAGEQLHNLATAPDAVHESVFVGGDFDQAEPAVVTPAITAYLNSVDPYKRAAAVAELARSRPPDAFALITNCFDDHSPHVRNAAARALRKLEPGRTVDLFNRALEEASAERRRNIGGAIAASGVATEAIENLVGENREETYSALSILFVMAKSGEIEPLERALAEHPDDEIGKAVTKLLALSGHR
jgi:hypothetical protein